MSETQHPVPAEPATPPAEHPIPATTTTTAEPVTSAAVHETLPEQHAAESLPAAHEAIPTTTAATVPAATLPPAAGETIANPAQPLAPTVMPAKTKATSFISKVENFLGYPKKKYHPVHGGIDLANPNEEASLNPPTDWFDTPEAADAARTWTEAHVASANNTRAKLAALDEAGHPIVRNSAQADESIRKGTPEPL